MDFESSNRDHEKTANLDKIIILQQVRLTILPSDNNKE